MTYKQAYVNLFLPAAHKSSYASLNGYYGNSFGVFVEFSRSVVTAGIIADFTLAVNGGAGNKHRNETKGNGK